jgi:Flp pilus assembly protein TadD
VTPNRKRAAPARAARPEADALNGLGDVLLQAGDAGKARAHYAAIGAPEAREIRAPLAMTGDGSDDGDKPAEENRDTYGLPG